MKEMLKRELNKTYLILSSEEATYQESYEIPMIINNEPQGMLPLHVLRVDGHLQLFYEVSSKQTLKDCAERSKLSGEIVRKLFQSLERLIKEVKDYLLDMECVVLDLEHIYTQEGEFYFCYCPWEKKEILPAFQSMLEEILGNLDYHDTEGVELAYHLYQNACKGDFCIGEILQEHCGNENVGEKETFENYFTEKENKEKDSLHQENRGDELKKRGIIGKMLNFFLKKEKHKTEEPQSVFYLAEQEGAPLGNENVKIHDMGECSQFEGNTTLLENMPIGCWNLRPLLPNYEEFCITEESFLVGKKRECVDGYINRDTISRIHSRLFVKNERLYIADANSTNGTYVNGESIPPGKDVEIFAGDRILFADVEYECYNSL